MALALSGAAVVLGDVAIVGCIKLDTPTFAASTSKHGVPQHRHEEVIGTYKNIFAWELSGPRRYLTSLLHTKTHGQITWVDVRYQQHVFDDVQFVHAIADDIDPHHSPGDAPPLAAEVCSEAVAAGASATSTTGAEHQEQARRAAEQRANDAAQRDIRDVDLVDAMRASSASADVAASHGAEVFGARRRRRLRDSIFQRVSPESCAPSDHQRRALLLNSYRVHSSHLFASALSC